MNNSIIYNVNFPRLGIFLRISPIALNLNGLCIHWYGIIIALGFLVAYLYTVKHASKYHISHSDLSDFVLSSSLTGIVFARIYYVLFYPGDFYKEHPDKIFMISEGGIAIYGAIIGGIIALWFVSKIKKKQFISVLDLMSPGVAIGQTIGRWGNFVNQEAFGTITYLPWGMSSENTNFITVHPCFLYESIGCLFIFLILHLRSLKHGTKKGEIFLLYTTLYGILRSLIEQLRTDSLLIPGTSIKISQILAITVSIFSFILLMILKFKKKSQIRKNKYFA